MDKRLDYITTQAISESFKLFSAWFRWSFPYLFLQKSMQQLEIYLMLLVQGLSAAHISRSPPTFVHTLSQNKFQSLTI